VRCQPCGVPREDRPTYTVSCHFAAAWWIIHVPEARDVTARVRFLDDVEQQARHAIALVMSVPEESFDVVIDVVRENSPT
jgi:hypothetical protein